MSETYHSSVTIPTVEQLKSVASKHHLNISDDDLAQYKDNICKILLNVYGEIDKSPDQCLSVKYTSNQGRAPTAAENPYNAWICITDMPGSGHGKLLGKTLAVKDNISMEGLPLTIGSDLMKGFVSEYNATVVDRILDEGATIRGRAVCEYLCFSGLSITSVTGPVLNPHDVTRMTGGSSSGSAALVAAGDVDMALGTDQGGSIRMPASWTGIVGLKPTHGLVPYTGIASLYSCMDHAGPMTRTVKDCALLLEVIAGQDGLDSRQPRSITAKRYSELLTGDVKGIRVGVFKEGFSDCEPDVEEIVRSAANKLIHLGASVEEFSSPLQEQAGACGLVMVSEGTYSTLSNGGISPLQSKDFKDVALHDFLFAALKTFGDDFHLGVKNLLLMNGYIKENYGHRFFAKAVNKLRAVVAGYDELFKKYDVIVMPTIKFKAPKIPTTALSVKEFLSAYMSNVTNTLPYNATGHPAISVNAGFSEGLPVGMMIIGRHWEDDVVMNVAQAVEQQRD